MRFLSFEANGQAGIGWVKDIHATDFVNLTLAAPELPRNLKDLICAPGGLAAADAAARKAPASAVQAMASVTMLPLIPNPGKIVCMGLNYADHAKEGGNARPEYPSFFLRGNSSMVGHNQPIVRPKASTQLDYEAELAVIIGKQARHLTAENALDCIAGYSCFNDGSIRVKAELVNAASTDVFSATSVSVDRSTGLVTFTDATLAAKKGNYK